MRTCLRLLGRLTATGAPRPTIQDGGRHQWFTIGAALSIVAAVIATASVTVAAKALGCATTVVCLNERAELADRYPEYVNWLDMNQPARAVWLPISDFDAPDGPMADRLFDDLRLRVRAGEGLLVHCGAGIGRSGTIAAGLLVTMGMSLEGALETVAAHRPMAGPEAGAQADLLTALAQR